MNPVVEMENVVKYYDQKRPVGLFRRDFVEFLSNPNADFGRCGERISLYMIDG